MNKLSKQEYIIKAAKLYGLGSIEIDALEKHLDGSFPNEFIERRTKYLFRLYDIYKSEDYNDKIDPDDNGIISLNEYAFEISKRRLADSKIGRCWIISSNLEAFLSVNSPISDPLCDVEDKYAKLAEKNNFVLPQIAKQMGLNPTIYYKGEYVNKNGDHLIHHLTKNFLYTDETLIQGNSIIKESPNKRRVSFEKLLETTDKYIKRYYKKYKLGDEKCEAARSEIRRGLIKQALFNKFVLNGYESNDKWGLIQKEDNTLRICPLFSYDYCAGVEFSKKTKQRTVDGSKEDIQSFMLKYGKEKWFKDWINNEVVTVDLDKAIAEMTKKTGITINDQEKEYYAFLLEKMHEKIDTVLEANYDDEIINKNRKIKFVKKLKNIKYTLSDKRSDYLYKKEHPELKKKRFFKRKDDEEER